MSIKRPSSTTPNLDALHEALDASTVGSRALRQELEPSLTLQRALQPSLALQRALEPSPAMQAALRSVAATDAAARWTRIPAIELPSTLRDIASGRYGSMESFDGLTNAVERMLEPQRRLGESVAAMTQPFAFADLARHDTIQDRLLDIATAATRMLEAARPNLPPAPDWTASFSTRLEFFQPDWSLAGVDLGVLEFGRLARLSDAVHLPDPYRPAITELVEEELQDDEEDDGNGFELFADEAMPTIVRAAGFAFVLPDAPMPVLEDGSPVDGSFDPSHHVILVDIERRLRTIVVEALGRYDGKDWKRKVPETVVAKWLGKQAVDRDQGLPVLGLIHYADLGDLADIIAGRGNWNNAFSTIFDHQTDVVTSIRRLLPLRNAVAHARPLSNVQAIWLMAEATRLYVQLGVPVVHSIR